MNDSPVIEAEGLRKGYGDRWRSTDVDLTVDAGQHPRRARAQRRRQVHDRPHAHHHDPPRRGAGRVAGFDVVAEAAAVRRIIGVTGQDATLDELLTGTQNLVMVGELSEPAAPQTPAPRGRAARALRAHRRRRSHGEDVLRRHAAPARPRRQPGGAPAGAVPRRADHRPRPHEPAAHVGRDPRLVADGTTVLLTTQYLDEADALADTDLGDRPRHRHRRGHRARAQGAHRRRAARGHARAPTTRPPARSAPLASGAVQVIDGGRSAAGAGRAADGLATAVDPRARRRRRRGRRLEIHHPSLDDVFFALTGHAAAEPKRSTTRRRQRARWRL